jgi:capsid assembly protease
MSSFTARQALMAAFDRMQMKPVLLDQESIPAVVRAAKSLQNADGSLPEDMDEEMLQAHRNNLCEAYGFSSSNQNKPFAFAEGTAIIPVHGTLINRYGGYYYGYATGYNYIRRQRAQAMVDPDVKRIIYDVNSPGGEAAGCFELSDESFELRGEKPTLAVVDSNCYSAAYAFASSADKISVTPTGGAGSIGVISMHTDLSKLLEDFGVKITLITAGEHKADGNPFEKLSPEVKAAIQKDVDDFRDEFVALVARNRGLDPKVVRDTEARCYSAKDALDLNLIDAVETPTKAVAAFITGPTGSNIEEPTMNEEEIAQANREAAAAAAAAERTRMAGIVGCEGAVKMPKLANHLAFSTDMSVEMATGILAAAALDIPAQAAANSSAAATVDIQNNGKDANSNFLNAMNNGTHPEAGANESVTTADPSEDEKAMSALEEGFSLNGVQFDKK